MNAMSYTKKSQSKTTTHKILDSASQLRFFITSLPNQNKKYINPDLKIKYRLHIINLVVFRCKRQNQHCHERYYKNY